MSHIDLSRAFQECSRMVSVAIQLDSNGNSQEAYRHYIDCCLKIMGMLATELTELSAANNDTRMRFAQLSCRVTERICANCPKEVDKQIEQKKPPVEPEEIDPTEEAQRKNRLLIAAHKKQISSPAYSRARVATLELELIRKMVENTEMGKTKKSKQQQQIADRQMALRHEAEMRFRSMKLDDQRVKDLLTNIMYHDDKYKQHISDTAELTDPGLANKFCTSVLQSKTHPIGELLRQHHDSVNVIVQPLLKYWAAVDACSPKSQLNSEQPVKDNHSCEDRDEMDYLFDGDDEFTTDNAAGSKSVELLYKELCANQDAFTAQCSSVVSDIHQLVNTVVTLLQLAYKQLDTPAGRDAIQLCTEETIFSSMKEPLLFLLRLCNADKERRLGAVMAKYSGADLSCMEVNEKWYLGARSGECYDELVASLCQITHIKTPQGAMKCAVEVQNGIVDLTREFYKSKGRSEPMGADDILPIICFLVMKTQEPSMISEFQYMDQFMPAESTMEEGGYALCTFQTAMLYLLTL